MRENLLHHEQADDAMVYPQIERMLGDGETMAPMHRTHREVQRLGGLLAQMICDLPAEGPDPIAVNDFRRVLYGLDAILRLHFAQENELYQSLAASTDDRATRLSAGPQV